MSMTKMLVTTTLTVARLTVMATIAVLRIMAVDDAVDDDDAGAADATKLMEAMRARAMRNQKCVLENIW